MRDNASKIEHTGTGTIVCIVLRSRDDVLLHVELCRSFAATMIHLAVATLPYPLTAEDGRKPDKTGLLRAVDSDLHTQRKCLHMQACARVCNECMGKCVHVKLSYMLQNMRTP
jgi:hypothetical protein